MSSMTIGPIAGSAADPSERSALLFWMIFTGLSIFAVVLLWRFGLIRLMLTSDRTYISSVIALLYVLTCGHCFLRTRAIAREGAAARRCRAVLAAPGGSKVLDAQRGRAATRAGAGPHREPRDESGRAGLPGGRPDAAAADAGRPAARLQRVRCLRLGHADEARPARHHHRLHHHAGADRGAGCRRQGRDALLDGADERRHGGRDVHDAGGPRRLDPGPHPVLHAGCRDPAGVLGRGGADRDLCDAGAGAQRRWNRRHDG